MRQVFDQLRADGLTPRTLARKMSTLRQFYRWARRKGLISEIPLRNIPIPKTGHTLPKPVSNADFKTLVNSAVMDTIEKKTSLDKNQISKVLSKNAPHPEQTAARRQLILERVAAVGAYPMRQKQEYLDRSDLTSDYKVLFRLL